MATLTVSGSGSSATTTVTIPAHAVGNVICIMARGTAAPTIPAAGGTVPTWTEIGTGGVNNSVGWRAAYTIATTTTHTSGTWTSAAQMHVLVVARSTGSIFALGNIGAQAGANNTQTIVYPAVNYSGTGINPVSLAVRYGARGTADTEVRTSGGFTTGGTFRTEQPATTPSSAVFTKPITANEGSFSATTAGVNAAYRAGSFELRASDQTVLGGVAAEADAAPAGTPSFPGISQAAYSAVRDTAGTQTGPSYTITPDANAPAIVTGLSIPTTVAATIVNGSVATETDTAPAGSRLQPQTPVSGAVAAEADSAPAGTKRQPQTPVTGGIAAEADTAPAGTKRQPQTPIAGGIASEADTAPAGTAGNAQAVSGGIASETNSAPAGTTRQPQTPVAGGVATEADSAPAGTPSLAVAGAAQAAYTAARASAGTQTGPSYTITPDGANAPAIVTALSIPTAVAATIVSGGTALEADTAPGGTASNQTTVNAGTASETDTAPAGSVSQALGGVTQAAYTATRPTTGAQTGPSYTITPDGANATAIVTALAVRASTAVTTVSGGVAPETDTAPAGSVTVGGPQTISGGIASEADTAPGGTPSVTAGGVTQAAYTAERASTGTQTGPSYTITPSGPDAPGIVTALSLSENLVGPITVSGGTATETDSAPAGSAVTAGAVIGPFIASEMGYAPAGALTEFAPEAPAARALGDPTVTTQAIARPDGLEHDRAQGDPVATGRHLQPAGQANTRAQGTPTLSGRVDLNEDGLEHERALGTPSVNLRTLTPTGQANTRNLGAPTATLVKIGRPDALNHTARALGTPTARGFMTIGPPSLEHDRDQGTPTLSGRALPAGLIHTRELGDTAVDTRTLQPAALDRA